MKQILTSFDFETDGLNLYTKKVKIYSYCIGYIDNREIKVIVKKYDKKGKTFLTDYFNNPTYIKICHNFKYELALCILNDITLHPNTLWHDTMLQHQLIYNTSHSHALDSVGFDLFGYTRELDIQFKTYMKAGITVKDIPAKFLHQYQVADGIRPLLIHYLLFPMIYKNQKLFKCYCNEVENVKVRQKEEHRGIMLHQENMNIFENTLKKSIKNLKKYYKDDLNLSSPPQLGKFLYEDLKIKPIKFTATGKPSTDKHVIMQLCKDNNLPQLNGIIKYRSYSAALTNIKKWRTLQSDKGCIHPNINTNIARTGRGSITNPNLHNMNKDKALLNKFPVPLRKNFRPRPNHVLIPVDYSSIELRLIINSSETSEIIEMVQQNPKIDLHHFTIECFSMPKIFMYKNDLIYKQGVNTAKKLKETDKVLYKLMRDAYKSTGFCIGYGGGIGKVSQVLGKTIKEIYYGDNNFRKRFPKINSFSKDKTKEVRETGGVTTAFGRFLHVDPCSAYAGANYETQGTAAEILKRGQVQLLNYIEKSPALKKDLHIILDVHDENIIECHKRLLPYKSEFLPGCSEAMITHPEISIPLQVEYKICYENWNDKQPLLF